jgi:hypothetical protein
VHGRRFSSSFKAIKTGKEIRTGRATANRWRLRGPEQGRGSTIGGKPGGRGPRGFPSASARPAGDLSLVENLIREGTRCVGNTNSHSDLRCHA